MKRKMLKLVIAAGVLFAGTYSYATGIEMVTNQSAKFWVNSARYATTDGADTAYYNPAGTAFMQEGTYFSISSQTLFIPYDESIEMSAAGFSESYSQDKPILVLPNFYLVNSLGQQGIGNLSVFCNAGIIGGGGALEWDGTTGAAGLGFGVAQNVNTLMPGAASYLTKSDVDFNASAAMYQIGAGAAYSFNDMVSLSAGARYVIARKSISIDGRYTFNDAGIIGTPWTLDVDYETELAAEGYCFIFGADVKPVKDLNIGFKYETETALRYKYDDKKHTASDSLGNAVSPGVAAQLSATDGTETDADFPSLFSIGAEYNVTDDLMVSASSVFYFMGSADMDGVEDYYKTGYDLTIGTTYRAMDNLKIGTSFNYTTTGAKNEYFEADGQMLTVGANPPLDWVYISGGATYSVTPALDITGSFAWIHYLPKDVTTSGGFDVEYEKEGYVFALEAGYKI
jgi:long-chain fatty acid transport protein